MSTLEKWNQTGVNRIIESQPTLLRLRGMIRIRDSVEIGRKNINRLHVIFAVLKILVSAIQIRLPHLLVLSNSENLPTQSAGRQRQRVHTILTLPTGI